MNPKFIEQYQNILHLWKNLPRFVEFNGCILYRVIRLKCHRYLISIVTNGEKSHATSAEPGGFVKPATHYSSLFANNDEIIFSRKNLNFAKQGENTPTHCSTSTAVFANMNFVFRATKSSLWVSSRNRSVERRRRRTQNEKPVRKTSAKMLYTLFVFCSFFVISLIFHYCSQ